MQYGAGAHISDLGSMQRDSHQKEPSLSFGKAWILHRARTDCALWAAGAGRARSRLAARCSAGWRAVWQGGWQMKALVLQVVDAPSSKICTLAAPRSVFWCPGSTVGICECLCLPALPAVTLPRQHQERAANRHGKVTCTRNAWVWRPMASFCGGLSQQLDFQAFYCKYLAGRHLPGQAMAPGPLLASSAALRLHVAEVTAVL